MNAISLNSLNGTAGAPSPADRAECMSAFESHPRARVLIVSNVRLYRDALQRSLGESGKAEIVGVSDVSAAADQVRRLGPEVVVLDASEGLSAAALARSLKALTPDLSVVVVASVRDEAEFLAWAEAGVSGYADQNSSADDLAAAVQHAARGEVRCSPRLAALLAGRVAKLSAERQRATQLDSLTPRERNVMALVAEGLSNKHIAQRLGISDTTTKNHVHNILDKLGLQSRGQAAAHYHRVCASP
jgi:two-component system, NarL family, nitrate/nitrite response regulator NarL